MRRHVRDFHPQLCSSIETIRSEANKELTDGNSSASCSDDDDKSQIIPNHSEYFRQIFCTEIKIEKSNLPISSQMGFATLNVPCEMEKPDSIIGQSKKRRIEEVDTCLHYPSNPIDNNFSLEDFQLLREVVFEDI
eukprot:gene29085-38143_t